MLAVGLGVPGAKGPTVPHKFIRQLCEILGQEQACYTSLLDVSRSQQRLLQQGAMNRLGPLLRKKTTLLETLRTIEAKLRPMMAAWESVQAKLGRADRQMLDAALETVQELLGELIALERESERLLTHRTTSARAMRAVAR